MDNRARYQEIFLGEARAHIITMEHALVALEQAPARFDLIRRIMRAAHSLKGDAKMMGYEACTDLAHHIETPLQRLHKEKKEVSAELITLLFHSLDTLEKLLTAPLTEPPDDFTTLLEALSRAESMIDSPPTVSPNERAIASLPLPPLAELRVNPAHLDSVLHLVEEMIMNQSELMQLRDEINHPALDRTMRKHKRLLTELRDAVLQTRLVPVTQMFVGFPRMVRDLATGLNKEAVLIIEGEDTELDRALLEPVHQMVGHLLRNAIVHGIELPNERETQSKLREGTVRLAARRERDHVVIEVSDDGRGLNAEKITAVALTQGYTITQIERMSQEQLWQLICEPGFSTLPDDEVSDVAGRGTGLDAVKQTVTALRGQLEIISTNNGAEGNNTVNVTGTCFRLKLPLTMAIAEVLLVSLGTEVYAIPERQVRRIVPLTNQRQQELEDITLHDLRELLEIPNGDEQPSSKYAIVLENGKAQDAVVVDKLLGKEDIVIKPLNGIKTTAGITGATVLGEGKVVLVLDALKLL